MQGKPTMQIQACLVICQILITQTAILKIVSSFGNSQAPGSVSATTCYHHFPWQVGSHLPPGQRPQRLALHCWHSSVVSPYLLPGCAIGQLPASSDTQGQT